MLGKKEEHQEATDETQSNIYKEKEEDPCLHPLLTHIHVFWIHYMFSAGGAGVFNIFNIVEQFMNLLASPYMKFKGLPAR